MLQVISIFEYLVLKYMFVLCFYVEGVIFVVVFLFEIFMFEEWMFWVIEQFGLYSISKGQVDDMVDGLMKVLCDVFDVMCK